MSNGPWTDAENDLIVADYFAMLADDVCGRPYNKAEHRRGLLPLLLSVPVAQTRALGLVVLHHRCYHGRTGRGRRMCRLGLRGIHLWRQLLRALLL